MFQLQCAEEKLRISFAQIPQTLLQKKMLCRIYRSYRRFNQSWD